MASVYASVCLACDKRITSVLCVRLTYAQRMNCVYQYPAYLDHVTKCLQQRQSFQIAALLSHYSVWYQRMSAYENYHSYAKIRQGYVMHRLYTFEARWHTLAYAGIRWHTHGVRWRTLAYAGISRGRKVLKIMFKISVRTPTYGLYAKHTLEVR